MDNIHENDVVVLLVDQPDAGLYRGDVGTVIQVYDSTPNHPSGLIVEFVDEFGNVQAQTDITDVNQIVKPRYRPVLEAA
ncbi:MAG: DUF4926 domain-containing protein [Acidobacteriota bacterium]|nr:DUF4926 domain-containing protein [Acidobacteriota bacterium]